ncbi:MAG: hypothetical protein U0136_13250 [Bdellovibrionota bacterium]
MSQSKPPLSLVAHSEAVGPRSCHLDITLPFGGNVALSDATTEELYQTCRSFSSAWAAGFVTVGLFIGLLISGLLNYMQNESLRKDQADFKSQLSSEVSDAIAEAQKAGSELRAGDLAPLLAKLQHDAQDELKTNLLKVSSELREQEVSDFRRDLQTSTGAARSNMLPDDVQVIVFHFNAGRTATENASRWLSSNRGKVDVFQIFPDSGGGIAVVIRPR